MGKQLVNFITCGCESQVIKLTVINGILLKVALNTMHHHHQ
jgi:hypothetical protein